MFPNPSPLEAPLTNPAISTKVIAALIVLAEFDIDEILFNRISGTATMPTFGSIVQNGKFSAWAFLDVVRAFHEFIKRPKPGGKVYNLGGGRKNSCSILEAIKMIEKISNKKSKYTILHKNRLGDHKWWISNNSKFIKDDPNWKIRIPLKKSLEQMIKFELENKKNG